METALKTRKRSTRTNWLCRSALACGFSLVMGASCFASTITLEWDPQTSPDVAGYKVYYGTTADTPFSGSGALQGSSPVNASNQNTVTITGLDPEQPHYFAVTAYNSQGIESPYSNILKVDELVPPSVSITYPANNSAVTGMVSVIASAADNVAVSYIETYVNGILQATDSAAPYLFSWDTTAQAAGAYTLSAKAYDAAGNVGNSVNVSVNVIKDATAPNVSLAAPGTGTAVQGIVPLSATATDDIGVAKVELYANGTLLFAGNVPPYSYLWDTSALASGSYSISAKAYDAAGNVGESASVQVSVLNDYAAPSVSITAPTGGSTASGTVVVSANATDDTGVAKVEFFLNGTLVSAVTAAPYRYNWNTLEAQNGTYTLSAKAYDSVGNVGQSATVAVNVVNDKSAPTVSITSPVAGSTANGTVTVWASASDNVAVTKVAFYLNGVLQATSTAAPYSFNWNTAALANGSYTLSAKAYDAAGNVGQSASVSVTVAHPVADTKPPRIVFIAPTNKFATGSSVRIAASATDNVAVIRMELYIDGVLKSSVSASSFDSNWTLAAGKHVITVKAYDQRNVAISSKTVTTY